MAGLDPNRLTLSEIGRLNDSYSDSKDYSSGDSFRSTDKYSESDTDYEN